MEFKEGVKVFGLRPELVIAMLTCKAVVKELTVAPFVITSVTEGKHSLTSLHYTGAAFDFRTKQMTDKIQEKVRDECRRRLTDEFDVVLEKTHMHVEFQPKR